MVKGGRWWWKGSMVELVVEGVVVKAVVMKVVVVLKGIVVDGVVVVVVEGIVVVEGDVVEDGVVVTGAMLVEGVVEVGMVGRTASICPTSPCPHSAWVWVCFRFHICTLYLSVKCDVRCNSC